MAMAKDPTTYGGRGGNHFDDGVENVNIVGIRTVNIRSGNQVDAIQVDYMLSDGSVFKGPHHGGRGGSASQVSLANGEWICKVEGKTNGSLVDQLTLSIKNAAGAIRKVGPFGKTGTTAFMKEGNIVALHGGAGDLLDRIGFYDLEDLARAMSKSTIFGGSGGGTFDDFASESGIVGVQKICIRAGNQVDAIQVVYRLANGQTWTSGRHGGGGGTAYSFSVGVGDFISKIEGKTNGTLIDQLTFTVTKDNGSTTIHGPYGITGKTSFSVEGNVIALRGRAGNLLDGLGFYLYAPLKRSKQFGGSNGDAFNDDPNTLTAVEAGPGLKISKLYIRSGNQVDSIRAEYVALGGSVVIGPSFGGTGGSPQVMDVGMDEVIEKMEGMTNGQLIDQVTFTMRNTKGQRRTAGPYGKTGQTPFSVTAPNGIHGFYGRAGNLMDALGVYYN